MRHSPLRRGVVVLVLALVSLFAGGAGGLLGVCGPFTDVSDAGFCPFVLEIFYLGITTGTSPTTYDPTAAVSRLQMAAFLSRSVDGVLKRGSRRAALKQFWMPQNTLALGMTTVGDDSFFVTSDGADIWVANNGSNTVSRVRGSDAKLLEAWTGATSARAPLVAAGRVLVAGATTPSGRLYRIDPAQTAGVVTTVASNLGDTPGDIAFDGSRIWTVNGPGASVSIVTPAAAIPWPVTTVAGFMGPLGLVYDGSNIWITDGVAGTLLKLSSGGSVLQTVTVGALPEKPVFDGANIWVPNALSNSVSVVRVSSGAILQTLTGNGLNFPVVAAFDGQRVLVTNPQGDSVSLWKAADLTAIGSLLTGSGTLPSGACSDGVNFWITLPGVDQLARF